MRRGKEENEEGEKDNFFSGKNLNALKSAFRMRGALTDTSNYRQKTDRHVIIDRWFARQEFLTAGLQHLFS